MQFILGGPDIPDTLLQAHEEGRVVFFCGAGISYPAGLPGFGGLVESIYKLTGTTQTDIEHEAFTRSQYDATLDLLERRLPGQRLAVRHALMQALNRPNLRVKGATDTHAALLRLARSRDGALRLVTTNFDRVFHTAAKRAGQPFQAYAAPMLPIPKNSRWDGLVYLHGLLPAHADDTSLNRLVVTSGDFGLAYLNDRWAARFVSELFRNYVVCFVGYSINDPVLRYMMDALAADRMLGEATPQAWALGDYEPGQERRKTVEWEAKGVTPILYERPAGKQDHRALHQSLHAWAETYRDGVLGKERIVVNHALAQPAASTQQDDFVGRMLWALSDKSGLPAKRFADFNPAPSLDWLLDPFSKERFQHSDLIRFGVPPRSDVDDKLRFSLIGRPAPYSLAPPMQLTSGGSIGSQWDDVMFHLARWLLRHLDDPRLLLWIAPRGPLHDRWKWLIEHELNRLANLERDGKTVEINEIRAQAPRAIPRPMMRTLWRLVLSGRVKSFQRSVDLYSWKDRFQREALTATMRLELRDLLAPQVVLREPFHWGESNDSTNEPTRLRQLVDWELTLAAEHVSTALADVEGSRWQAVLPVLVDDLQQLLRDALDLLQELDEADTHNDPSHWDLPSVSPHWQNRGFRDWVSLIELVRDAWLEIGKIDHSRAVRMAASWFDFPYPTFKRLALFAASQGDCVAPEQWVNWLLSDGAWWLWANNTKREVLRLLVLQGNKLPREAQQALEMAILVGPPREMYREDLDAQRWIDLRDHEVWLHLSKLKVSGLTLGDAARQRLAEVSSANPLWQLAANERDEFSHWMSGTGDPDYETDQVVDVAPLKRRELVQWLLASRPQSRGLYSDTWREVCRSRFALSLCALAQLAAEGKWPADRWQEALQVWSEDAMVRRAWRRAAPIVEAMPDAVMVEIAHGVSWWIQAASKSIARQEEILLTLCRRLMELPLEAGGSSRITRNGVTVSDPVGTAINHPIGHVTQALINIWLNRSPNDKDLLPANIRPFFDELCDANVARFLHGRVVLSSRLIALFRVDQPWTEEHLLPLLNWERSHEAKCLWEGFLWSPRLHQPLLLSLKQQFLACAEHYTDLGDHAQQFAAFLTYAALVPIDGYTIAEFRSAFQTLPQDGLEKSAQALTQALEGAAEQREAYWKNRIQPFWQSIWPKSRDLATSRIAESLARLTIAAGNEFPTALAAVKDWLLPLGYAQHVVSLLKKSGLCGRFPRDALQLLDAVIANQDWSPRELGPCLNEVAEAEPTLARDYRFQNLLEYSRRRSA